MDTTGSKVYCLAAAALSALYAVLFVLYPKSADDLWFTDGVSGVEGSWEYLVSTFNNCLEHWQFDTGRLPAVVSSPFLGFLPKWIYAVLTAAMIFLIYQLGPRLARFTPVSIKGAAWVLIVTFVFPWMEYMFTVIYSIHYVWTTALALVLLLLFASPKTHSPVGVLLLAVIMGWWHEGMSAPMIAGMVVFLVVRWRKPSRTQALIIIGLAIGISILMLMPAFREQVGSRESHLFKSVWWETVMNVVAFNFIYYLYLLVLAVMVICRRTRVRLLSDGRMGLAVGLGVMVFGAIGTVIYFRYYNGPRTGAFNQLLCVIGLMYLLRYTSLAARHLSHKKQVAAVVVAFALSFVNLSAAIRVQMRLTEEYDQVQKLRRSGGDIVFFDPSPISIGLDFLKPSYFLLNTEYGLRGVELFPEVLMGFTPESPYAIGSSDGRLIIYRNCVLMRGAAPPDRIDLLLTAPDGRTELSRTRCREFATPDGRRWTYIVAHTQLLNPDFVVADARICE